MLPKIRKQYAIRKIAHGGGTTLLKVTRNIEWYAFSWRVDIKVSFDSTRRSRRILTAFTETRVTVSRLNSKSLEFFHRRKKVRLQSIACRVISQHVTIPSTYRLTFHPIVSNTDTASGLSRWIYRQAHRSRASLSFFHVASAKFPRVHESETRDRSTSMHVETRFSSRRRNYIPGSCDFLPGESRRATSSEMPGVTLLQRFVQRPPRRSFWHGSSIFSELSPRPKLSAWQQFNRNVLLRGCAWPATSGATSKKEKSAGAASGAGVSFKDFASF